MTLGTVYGTARMSGRGLWVAAIYAEDPVWSRGSEAVSGDCVTFWNRPPGPEQLEQLGGYRPPVRVFPPVFRLPVQAGRRDHPEGHGEPMERPAEDEPQAAAVIRGRDHES